MFSSSGEGAFALGYGCLRNIRSSGERCRVRSDSLQEQSGTRRFSLLSEEHCRGLVLPLQTADDVVAVDEAVLSVADP